MRSSPPVYLIARAGAWWCAIPVSDVAETMRPLPVTPIADAPRGVRGVATVRGETTPVVDLAAVLSGDEARNLAPCPTSRFIVVRDESWGVALAVDEVAHVDTLDDIVFEQLPSLLTKAAERGVEAIASRDGRTLALLRATRILPDDARRALLGEPR